MSAAYEVSLSELSQKIAHRRWVMEKERDEILTKKKQLQTLLQDISKCSSAFDEEDRTHVSDLIQSHDARLQTLEATLQAEETKRKEREQFTATKKEKTDANTI